MAKVNLYADFKELFKLLNSARAEYLMLGGYAVVYHGYACLTQDIDVWIGTSDKNAEKVARVICEWGGYSSKQVSPSLFQQPGKVFVFGHPPGRMNLLTRPDGVEFERCYNRRVIADLDGVRVPVISLADLRQNKAASGRLKDQVDLEHLPTPADVKRTKRRKK